MINVEKMSWQEKKDLIFEFYLNFSTFEYALKTNNFLLNQKNAQPDWDGYIKSIKIICQTL